MTMDTMYWPCADALALAAGLGADGSWPSPVDLRKQIVAELRRMVARCKAAGIAEAEIAEARYAIVAFVDDRVLRSSWPGRTEWMKEPLQVQMYREYAAGENFFARLGALLRRKDRPLSLEVYYLCLALGFTGAGPAKGGPSKHPESYVGVVRERLSRPLGAALSPHALPAAAPPARSARPRVALPLAITCAVVTCIGLALLHWSLATVVERTARHLDAAASVPGQLEGK